MALDELHKALTDVEVKVDQKGNGVNIRFSLRQLFGFFIAAMLAFGAFYLQVRDLGSDVELIRDAVLQMQTLISSNDARIDENDKEIQELRVRHRNADH